MVTNTAMATIPRMMACRDGMTTNDMAHKAADTLGRWSRKDRIRLRMIRLWSGVPGSLKISHGKSLDTPALRVSAHAAEMIATSSGLGYGLFLAQKHYQTDDIVLIMIVIGALWLLMDRFILAPLERRTVQRWGMTRKVL